MGVFKADGGRVTLAAFPKTTVADPEVVVTQDLYRTQKYGPTDSDPDGALRTLLCRAGAVMRQSEVNALFPAATISTVTPSGGPAAGGTVVTITGTNLDGVTAVQFGGTAGTALTVVSPTRIQVTAPAGAAGAKDVVVVDDSGNKTKTGGFTYA